MKRYFLLTFLIAMIISGCTQTQINYQDPHPFGQESGWAKTADNFAIGNWWQLKVKPKMSTWQKNRNQLHQWIIDRPRDQVLAFALYTHDHGVLKLTAQCFPLHPDEPKTAVLEFEKNGKWKVAQKQTVQYPGWSLHFRIKNWDNTKDVPYRVRLGDLSTFEGLIRRDPVDKDTIVVATMTGNSPKDKERFARTELVENLRKHDPDLLFFSGDQSYHHDEHTFGWLQFGVMYADVMKDRPTICIPDDHDVGHPNIWGANGKISRHSGGADGGYFFPASFVNMVQRCQTWNLPDPFDPTPIMQGITVYYTDLNLGGISFAILEDRKFKSPPIGNIPKMGPRPDHINDPSYDRKSVDKPGLKLLGDRQLNFLDHWARNWDGASIKAVLSQGPFCGAVHLHGSQENRLLADLDCNGWPQTGRNNALRALRRARATHLAGDQHLAFVVKHGIETHRDGPFVFSSPALVNTIYGRWWWPLDEKPGTGEPIKSVLPWVGDYEDGLGNKITMHAYANPDPKSNTELKSKTTRDNRGDGYALIHFNKSTGNITFECWPRFADLSKGDAAQFKGWPITINTKQNDGRKPVGYLQEVKLPTENAVVELTNDKTGELIYCYRVKGKTFKAPVYSKDKHTLKAGKDKANTVLLKGVKPE